jgi:hypothetical protein
MSSSPACAPSPARCRTRSKYLNESVDKVRRQEHKELLAEGDETLKGTRQL